MKRLTIAAALLGLSTLAAAADTTCPKLEFAEMDAMSREELLDLRCTTARRMWDGIKAYGSGAARSSPSGCADEMTRQDRIIARKYGLGGTPAEQQQAVRALCNESPGGKPAGY